MSKNWNDRTVEALEKLSGVTPNTALGGDIVLTGTVQQLAAVETIATFRLTASLDNTADITVTIAGSGSYKLSPGSASELYENVDMATFSVTGPADHIVTKDGWSK